MHQVHVAGPGRRAGHAWPGLGGRRAAEVQLLALATRGQEVAASGLEDGPFRGSANGGSGRGGDQGARRLRGRLETPWVLT